MGMNNKKKIIIISNVNFKKAEFLEKISIILITIDAQSFKINKLILLYNSDASNHINAKYSINYSILIFSL